MGCPASKDETHPMPFPAAACSTVQLSLSCACWCSRQPLLLPVFTENGSGPCQSMALPPLGFPLSLGHSHILCRALKPQVQPWPAFPVSHRCLKPALLALHHSSFSALGLAAHVSWSPPPDRCLAFFLLHKYHCIKKSSCWNGPWHCCFSVYFLLHCLTSRACVCVGVSSSPVGT